MIRSRDVYEEASLTKRTITGRIYMIVGSEHEQVYIGSTTLSLAERFTRHKSLNSKCTSKKLINDKEVGIYLIEEREFEDKNALRWRERYWWEMYDTINKERPIATLQEHKELSKIWMDNISEEKKKLYKQNEKNRHKYQCTWGGWNNPSNNNLLRIDIDIFN